MSAHRILNSIKSDIKFQFKHGFYGVYIILSMVYIIILSFVPSPAKNIVLPVLIYTDPAGLGLFFIGGMVLLEKNQGVLALLYITPLKVWEYIISKILSLGIISVLVAVTISLASVGASANYTLLILGTLLGSVFYTLIGFLIASRCKSVNDYIVKMVPFMMLVILPCLSLIKNDFVPIFINKIMLLIPAAGGLKMILGAFNPISFIDIAISLSGLIVINTLLIKRVYRVFTDTVILGA